jgi:hypothetical protein
MFRLFFVILIVEIVYLAFSWDRVANMFSASDTFSDKPIRLTKIRVIFFARVVLIILIVLLLILMCCEPVSAAEQVCMQLSFFATSLAALLELIVTHCRNSCIPCCLIIT